MLPLGFCSTVVKETTNQHCYILPCQANKRNVMHCSPSALYTSFKEIIDEPVFSSALAARTQERITAVRLYLNIHVTGCLVRDWDVANEDE